MRERRKPENAKLRVYFEALKDARKHTLDTWSNNLIQGNMPYMSLESWIAYLEQCVIKEAAKVCGANSNILTKIAK